MTARRYHVRLVDHWGRRVRLNIQPFLIVDLDTEAGLRTAEIRFAALLDGLCHLAGVEPDKASGYRLEICDPSGNQIGHWAP